MKPTRTRLGALRALCPGQGGAAARRVSARHSGSRRGSGHTQGREAQRLGPRRPRPVCVLSLNSAGPGAHGNKGQSGATNGNPRDGLASDGSLENTVSSR